MRSGTTYNTYYEIAISPPNMLNDMFCFQVGNFAGGARTFSWDLRTATGGGGTLVDSGTITSLASGAVHDEDIITTKYNGNTLYLRVKQTTNATCEMRVIANRLAWGSHTHSTPAHTHPAHDHTVTIGTHTHTVTIGTHTHTVTIGNHTHSTPNHTHDLTYGIYESAVPATVRVYLDGSLITALNDLTLVSDFDLLPYVSKDSNGRVAEGWHALEFKSATVGATGSVRGCLFQRKFISTEAA